MPDKRRGATGMAIVILVVFTLVALLLALCYFGCAMRNEYSASANALTGNADEAESKQGKAEGKRFSPSFKGRGKFGSPPVIGASQVEDDRPVPSDGGGTPSQEKKSACAPNGPDSDF